MIKRLLHKIWHNEDGFVNSAELILIAVLAVIGLIVGLATLRNSVNQELADTSAAVGNVNQSYQVRVNSNGVGNPEDNAQIIVAGNQVTVNRDFTDGMGNVIVSTTSRFRNFRYNDRTDVGDGQDTPNTAPPGITSLNGGIIEEN